MLTIKNKQDKIRLRRIALAAQGLLQSNPFGSGLQGAIKAINHLGYVQLDSISVIERAHHHVLYSRVPNFATDMTNQMLLNKDVFEYWAHAAAFLPISDFRFSLPYKHAIKNGQVHWYKNPDKKLMKELLARIRADGPIRSRDIQANKKKNTGWWDWKPAKKALEQLYMQGDLMVCDREGFQKKYDLTERVLPSGVNCQMPSIQEFAEHVLNRQLQSHGLVAIKALAYHQTKNAELKKAIKKVVEQKLAQGLLEQVKVSDGEIFILKKGSFEKNLPRLNDQISILSPFDNSVIQRARLKSLFQYDYQLECYVPEAKRKYGYFSLPLLYQDEFVGRMDCKAHRKTKELEIKFLHFEQHDFAEEKVVAALSKAIEQFAKFQQCDSVSLTDCYPKKLNKILKLQLKSIANDWK